MQVTIQPGSLSGNLRAPASKSSMQRACAAALLCEGTTEILNPGHSNDDMAAMDTITRLGAEIEKSADRIVVKSRGIQPLSDTIFCGESGLGIRMFTPLVALSERALRIDGTGSLRTRPMDFFDEILPKLKVKIQSQQGKLPLDIQGPLQPADITVDGSLSSQFLTGLLMAYSAAGASGVSIHVNELKSRPYIDLTLSVMRSFGMKVPENRNYESFYFDFTTVAPAATRSYEVEGDWSGGAFLLVAGAIAGNITVGGLDLNSTQADKAILQALQDSGAGMSVRDKEIELRPSSLKAFQFDATDCPDLFPPLVALAACCQGTTVITGVSRLAHKESDRGITLQDEFGKMGIKITLQDDLMLIEGGTGLKAAQVHSRHDHRIAMACAVAALRADGPVSIEEAEAINKSYPDFYGHIQQLGAELTTHGIKVHG